MLCDTADGTGGGGKCLCEPRTHTLLSRSHDSLLIYSPQQFLFFGPLSIWLRPYQGCICFPSEGNKDASVRVSSGHGNVHSFEPNLFRAPSHVLPTEPMFSLLFFCMCSDKTQKPFTPLLPQKSTCSLIFSVSHSFYFLLLHLSLLK